MRKILLALVFLFVATGVSADNENLYYMFEDKPHIKVYLKEATSEVNDPAVSINEFKRIFDDVHRNRVNIKFMPVDSPDKADVIVTAKIVSYSMTERALPSLFGAAALVADTTSPKSSATLSVNYTIIDAETGKVLSEFDNFKTDARRRVRNMKGAKAFEFAAEKNISRFIYRAFHKQKPKAHEVGDN